MEEINYEAFLVEKSEMSGQLSAADADVDVVVVSRAGLEFGGETFEEHVAAFGMRSSRSDGEIVHEEAEYAVVVGRVVVSEAAGVSVGLLETPFEKEWNDCLMPVVASLLRAVERGD